MTTNTDANVSNVLAAYLGRNEVHPEQIPEVAASIRKALDGEPTEAPFAGRTPPRALTPKEIKDSVKPDAVICFEDGKTYKSMKRVLSTLGLSPDDYRKKWGLPSDHPITAPNYSAERRRIAKERGFGNRRQQAAE